MSRPWWHSFAHVPGGCTWHEGSSLHQVSFTALACVVAAMCASVASGQQTEPVVSVQASRAEVTLGEPLTLSILVVHPSGSRVTLPASLPLGPAFVELSRTQVQRTNDDGTAVSEFQVKVVPYELGDRAVPELPVSYLVDGQAHQIWTRSLAVRVASYVGERGESPRPPAGPVEVVHRDWRVLWGAALVFGSAALLGFGFLAWKRLRRATLADTATGASGPRASAAQEALAQLAELEASGALDAVELEPAYVRLSEIVRAYVGRRFGFGELDLTTSEIRAAFANASSASPELVNEVVAWLCDCDLVKFAAAPASAEQARSSLYWARQLVHRTGPAGTSNAEPASLLQEPAS